MTDKNEIDDTKIIEAFNKALGKEQTDDEIKLALVKAGVAFSAVQKKFNDLMVDGGHRISASDKAALVEEVCKDADLSTAEGFEAAVNAITDSSDKISEKSASASVRAYARKNDMECFKKPKGGGRGQVGFAHFYHKFLIENPTSSDEEVSAYINEQPDRKEGSEVSQNVIRHASHYRGLANLVKAVHSNATGN